MIKKILLLCAVAFVAFSMTGCLTDETGARRVLTTNGYENIQLTGYDFFTCGHDDTFSTGFTADSSSGQHVTGAVCSAFLKGSTIRFK